MKKVFVLLILGAFVLSGALLNSCKKDELNDKQTSENVLLKDLSDFDLPLYMGQTTLIGHAEIYIATETVYVNVILDPAMMWMPYEAHLYAGDVAPQSGAPGQFPYHWYEGDPEPIQFAIDISDWWECEEFDWYFALHLALKMEMGIDPNTSEMMYAYESAWLLPEEGGTYWMNKKMKPIGWGQYFLFNFDYVPEITDLELMADQGMVADPPLYWQPSGTWYPLAGDYPAFSICLAVTNPYYYFGVQNLTLADELVGLQEDYMNEFKLGYVEDPLFWSYWDAKGVNAGASGDWREFMWDIINGDLPMFYLVWDGSDYMLVDGLQYLAGSGVQPLRISGDYPLGTYEFTGTVMGVNCESEPMTILLTVGCP